MFPVWETGKHWGNIRPPGMFLEKCFLVLLTPFVETDPASRGLSRRGKMKRGERDLCRLPGRVVWWSRRPIFWSKLTGFQNRFRLVCNARALLDCTLTIIEPTVDYGFYKIREFQNFSLWSSHKIVCFYNGDKRIKEITSLQRKVILGFRKGHDTFAYLPTGYRKSLTFASSWDASAIRETAPSIAA